MRSPILLLLSFLGLLLSCSPESTPNEEESGPFLANGFHNGWADSVSIVIWTRLTAVKEARFDGPAFKDLSREERRALDKSADKEQIHSAQIPEGYTLDQMEGACPGATGEVRLTYHPIGSPDEQVVLPWIPVNDQQNYTRQWKLEGLSPDMTYRVTVEARKNARSSVSDRVEGKFYTPPLSSQQKEISFALVSCHDYIRKDQPGGHKIYRSMLALEPDFYVHTGDIEYYDKSNPWAMTEELMRFKWDRLFALPLQRELWMQTTSYFMKDDHDALRNDVYPGMTYGTVSFERGLEIFDKEQFPTNDRLYETIRWGKDLQIWITEGRNFRSKNTDPDERGKSIWGEEQKNWLFRTLKESDATFKILITNDPILGPDRENKSDNYANSNWQYEGDEIRDYLNQFDNLYITCGDRHWQYVTHYENSNLWEFGTGSGADQHAGGWKQDDKRPEHRFLRVKGGYLYGKVTLEEGNSALTLQHHDVDGNVVHEEVFTGK